MQLVINPAMNDINSYLPIFNDLDYFQKQTLTGIL